MPVPANHPLLLSVLKAHRLTAKAALLAPFASVGIQLAPTDEVTGCRLGGEAMLPEGTAWPVHQWSKSEMADWPPSARAELDKAIAAHEVRVEADHVAMPLRFAGVIDFARIAPLEPSNTLPRTGRLHLFLSAATATPDDLPARVAAAALYAPEGVPSVVHVHPSEPEHPLTGTIHLAPRHAIVWNEDTWNEMNGALSVTELKFLTAAMVGEESAHWMLPAPTVEQGMPVPPEGHTSLLRLAEVSSIGLLIDDTSWVTWIVPDEDLSAARFDRTRATMFVG
jgi:hypothetical protein